MVLEAHFALPLARAFGSHPLRIARHQQRRDAFQRVAGVAIGVDGHLFAILAAQDLPDGHAVALADHVQQRGLDAVDGMEHQARGGVDDWTACGG